jgi:hypothetical protein
VASFTGRKEVLDKMHEYFRSDCDFQCVFVLHGLGGSGKSQLAFKFVQESTQYGSTIQVYEITTSEALTICIFHFQLLQCLLH